MTQPFKTSLSALMVLATLLLLGACTPSAVRQAVSAPAQTGQQTQPQQPAAAPVQAQLTKTAPVAATSGPSTAYQQSGGVQTKAKQTYSATNTDESAVYVTKGGALTLTDATITTSGNSSSTDNSSFHGLNAAVLANKASSINLANSVVNTSGSGANGVFAEGEGSAITLSNVKITATGGNAHAVMATNGGYMTLDNVDMSTAGPSSGAIATDRGGGTIVAAGGNITTSGGNSPGIYSTGNIMVANAAITATGAEAAVIEGSNTISLTNTALTSSKEDKWGVMIYRSFSGDAEGQKGIFSMTGGSLAYTAANGPLFYVTNSTGVITLKGVNVTATSGTLIKAVTGSWNAGGPGGAPPGGSNNGMPGAGGPPSGQGNNGAQMANTMPAPPDGSGNGMMAAGGPPSNAGNGTQMAGEPPDGSNNGMMASGNGAQMAGMPPAPPDGSGNGMMAAGNGAQMAGMPPAPPGGGAGGPGGTTATVGGTVFFTADGQTLTGNLITDDTGSITAALQNKSTLTGAINLDNSTKLMNLSLDSTSVWNVTGDSYLTCLTNPDGIAGTTITNITGNGHTVYYNSGACSALGGQTYTLTGGGELKPVS